MPPVRRVSQIQRQEIPQVQSWMLCHGSRTWQKSGQPQAPDRIDLYGVGSIAAERGVARHGITVSIETGRNCCLHKGRPKTTVSHRRLTVDRVNAYSVDRDDCLLPRD